MTDKGESVSLKEHFEALRAADLRNAEDRAEWTKEKFALHNNLLDKWREASERDRGNFVTSEAFDALKAAFDVYKDITAKALALAEGKSKGLETVRVGITFVLGMLVAAVGLYAATKGLR